MFKATVYLWAFKNMNVPVHISISFAPSNIMSVDLFVNQVLYPSMSFYSFSTSFVYVKNVARCSKICTAKPKLTVCVL